MVMLIGMALLLAFWLFGWLLVLGTGFGTIMGALAGCGRITGVGIGGAKGCGGGAVAVWQQHFHRQNPSANRQMAAPIMAAGEVKAQCASGVLSWSS